MDWLPATDDCQELRRAATERRWNRLVCARQVCQDYYVNSRPPLRERRICGQPTTVISMEYCVGR